jgi:hypothetical protein
MFSFFANNFHAVLFVDVKVETHLTLWSSDVSNDTTEVSLLDALYSCCSLGLIRMAIKFITSRNIRGANDV